MGVSSRERRGKNGTHIVGVCGDVLEEGDSDPVVAALAEVTSALSIPCPSATTVELGGERATHPEVPATQMDADGHISGMVRNDVVVHLDVERKQRFVVDALLLHSLQHLIGAEVREQRVIELDVALVERFMRWMCAERRWYIRQPRSYKSWISSRYAFTTSAKYSSVAVVR